MLGKTRASSIMEFMEDFDIELLISLVEAREVLWDKTLEIYKDKRKSLKAWLEICHIMNKNFAELPDMEKNKYGKLLAQKWKNIRDTWIKCDKKLRVTKSGSGAKPIHKYHYYDNLQFLKKIIQRSPVSGSNMPEERPNIPEDKNKANVTIGNKRKKTEEMNAVDQKMIKFIENLEKEEDTRLISFFKGIAPSVERFNEDDTVEFQYQVLNIIRNIQCKNNNAQHQSRTRTDETYLASGDGTAAGPSSRNQSQTSLFNIENDSSCIGSPSNSSIFDFNLSAVNEEY